MVVEAMRAARRVFSWLLGVSMLTVLLALFLLAFGLIAWVWERYHGWFIVVMVLNALVVAWLDKNKE